MFRFRGATTLRIHKPEKTLQKGAIITFLQCQYS